MKGDGTLLKWIASTLKRLSNRKHPHGTIAQTSQSRPAGKDQSFQAPQFLPNQVAETSQRVRVTKGRVRDVQSNADSPPAGILQPFLNSRGIQIKALRAEDASDKVIDRLSLYLGERYDTLSGLHRKIKAAMQEGKRVNELLTDRPQQDINTLRQFCTLLHEVAFLEEYRYFRTPVPRIRIKTTTFPKAHNLAGNGSSDSFSRRSRLFVLRLLQKSPANWISSI